MNERFPQEEGAKALEGTAAHWAAWRMLADDLSVGIGIGTPAPNGVTVTDEMIEGAEVLIEAIQRLASGLEYHIEERTDIKEISESCFGTPDLWAIDLASDPYHLYIFDYKFGHRYVEEYWNPQGLCYLAGILDLLRARWNITWAAVLGKVTVSFTVVQPRCYYRGSSVRTHTFQANSAKPYLQNLHNAGMLAIMHEPTATTNPTCGDCPGRHVCPALQQAAYDAAEFANARVPLELTPLAAALELRLLERAQQRLEARVEGLKQLTIQNIREGKGVPYYRVEQGYGRTTWKVPEVQVIEIGKLFGKDLSKPDVVTPTQARKLGMPDVIVDANSYKPATSLRLIPENATAAAKVFGKGE